MFSFLTQAEADGTRVALESLSQAEWARPLLTRVREEGGVCSTNRPLMFEARVANAYHLSGTKPQYEYSAGVGGSTVDFALFGQSNWLVEVVSIGVSRGSKAATRKNPVGWQRVLSTPNEYAGDKAIQSTEHEMLLVGQKIGEKVFRKNKPTKFPITLNAFHMILIDAEVI